MICNCTHALTYRYAMFHSERGHSFDFILFNTGRDNEQSRVSVTNFIITVDLTDGPALIRQTLQTVWGQTNVKRELYKGWMKQFSLFSLFFLLLSSVQVSPFFYTLPLDHKPSIHPLEIALCIGKRIGTGREKRNKWICEAMKQKHQSLLWLEHDVPALWTGGMRTLSALLKSPNYSLPPFYKQTWDSSYPIKTDNRSLAWRNYSFGDWIFHASDTNLQTKKQSQGNIFFYCLL